MGPATFPARSEMLDAVIVSEAPMGLSKVTRTRPFSSTVASVAV